MDNGNAPGREQKAKAGEVALYVTHGVPGPQLIVCAGSSLAHDILAGVDCLLKPPTDAYPQMELTCRGANSAFGVTIAVAEMVMA